VLLSGTNFKNGNGQMMIIAVGPRSAIGKIRATITDKEDDETPLQKKLEKIANQIGLFGLISGICVLILMIVRAILDKTNLLRNIINAFLVSITVVVVAIPEGLPLAVTLSLAFSVKKMLKEKNLVKKLHACETMGGANVICSDKTGTLTKNEMYLTDFWNLQPNKVYDPKTEETTKLSAIMSETCQIIFTQITCCNSSAEPGATSGNPTELAIIKYLDRCGVDIKGIRQKYKKVADEPFSSDRKRMSTLIKDHQGKELMVISGASELILEGCDKLQDLKSGEIKQIGHAERDEIKDAITKFAEKSLRTIGLAYSYPAKYDKNEKDANGVLTCESSGLTLIGICGIKDIIRPEVPGAIEACRTAGIEVKMVTGDNKITARAIAVECGIIKSDEIGEYADFQVMLGKDFFEYVGGYTVTKDKEGNSVYSVTNGDRFTKIYKHV
jgi:Ca2+ transporting ATPase